MSRKEDLLGNGSLTVASCVDQKLTEIDRYNDVQDIQIDRLRDRSRSTTTVRP